MWQQHVDELCALVESKAVLIAGRQDGSIWAKKMNEDIPITQEELKLIGDNLTTNSKSFLESGVILGGQKFTAHDVDEKKIVAREGTSTLCIMGTNAALIVAIGADGYPSAKLSKLVGNLGWALSSQNY